MTVSLNKRWIFWVLFTGTWLVIGFACGWAEDQSQPRLNAPGGAEIDFVHNITKSYGTSAKPVVAVWSDFRVEAGYLEYDRDQATVRAEEQVKITQELPVYRITTCDQLFLDLKRELLTAQDDVMVFYDEITSLAGNRLEWDRKNDSAKITGAALIKYKDWKITGERIEGQINKGVFIVYGPVKGMGTDCSLKAGQIIFDRSVDKIFLKNNPVVIQGKNEFSAPEIIYDLKTQKVSTRTETRVN